MKFQRGIECTHLMSSRLWLWRRFQHHIACSCLHQSCHCMIRRCSLNTHTSLSGRHTARKHSSRIQSRQYADQKFPQDIQCRQTRLSLKKILQSKVDTSDCFERLSHSTVFQQDMTCTRNLLSLLLQLGIIQLDKENLDQNKQTRANFVCDWSCKCSCLRMQLPQEIQN
jgi:hypothetical protein